MRVVPSSCRVHIPPVLAVIVVLLIVALVLAAAVLRQKAQQARLNSLDRLQVALSHAQTDHWDDGRKTQIGLIIEDVQSGREGALKPLIAGPLLPFTGVGGLVLLEQLRSLW